MKRKLSNIVFVGIIVFLAFVSVKAATYLYNANEVSYDNTKSGLASTDVQSAMSELYTKCNASTTTCPSGHTCIDKTNIKCKRATTLHTETCTNSSTSQYCQADGYALNDTITYGNTATTEGVLTIGDAFDCDVDGTGYNHRFYYISDYFDTSTKKFNDKVAVLVYYSNTDDGVASTTYRAYDSSGENYNGPVTARSELPTTTQWSNIRLYKSTRQILAQNNATETSGGTFPTSFDYSGYSARLLTYQEIYHGCNGSIKNCKFLFERTRYANSSLGTFGVWTETPEASRGGVYIWNSDYRTMSNYSSKSGEGVRPTIEVLKSEILY